MVYKKGGVKKKAPVQHTKDDPQPAIFKKKTKTNLKTIYKNGFLNFWSLADSRC